MGLVDIFNTNQAVSLNLVTVVFNLLLAFVLSSVIALVYKYTHKGLSYSQSFVFTLVLVGMIISAVMMVIGNSIARAFGAFGAFSIIRFRTVVKDTKDMAFVFLTLVIGMATGTDNYLIALVLTVIVIIIILILSKINFGSIRKYDYILNLSLDSGSASNDVYRATFDKFLKSHSLLHVATREAGKILDLTFNVKFIDDEKVDSFSNELGQLPGVSNINLVSSKSDIEY